MHATYDKEKDSMGAWDLIGTAGLLAIAFTLAMAGCKGGEGSLAVERPAVTGVTVEAVSPKDTGDVYEAAGTVRTDLASTIASRVMGTITSVKVREGDTVKAGDLLVTIDDRDAAERARAASMAVESARVNRDLARATWGRYRGLFEQKALTSQEMDQVDTQRKVAEAEYARAQAMAAEAATARGFARITAPLNGRVIARMIDAGSTASPGMPLLTIEGEGERYVEAAADEGLSGKIRAGMPVEVVVEYLQKTIPGRVREIVPAVDPRSRSFLVKVSVDDPGLRSGLYVRVRIPLASRSALLVPVAAVVAKGQLTGVYAVDPSGVVTYRLVRTGRVLDDGVEVLSGLSPNERIVTAGADRAIDGGVIKGEGHK